MSEQIQEKPATKTIRSGFRGLVVRLEKFKGALPDGWGVDWKMGKTHRQLALLLDVSTKDGDREFSLDEALRELGYVRADGDDRVAPAYAVPNYADIAKATEKEQA